MFKTLFNIIVVLVGLSASAHTNDFQLLNSDFETLISVESTGEVYKFSAQHHQFYDVQTETYNFLNTAESKPSRIDESSNNTANLCYRSNFLSLLHSTQYALAECNNFYNSRLRKTLYPFHSFW